MDSQIKSYVTAEKALQRKYDELRKGTLARKGELEEKYKPLITPLRELKAQLRSIPAIQAPPDPSLKIPILSSNFSLPKSINSSDLELLVEPVSGLRTPPFKPINSSEEYYEILNKSPLFTIDTASVEPTEEIMSTLGPTATKYMKLFMTKNVKTDNTYGLYTKRKDNNLYIGNSSITVDNDDIILNSTKERFKGTEGLWQLLILADPEKYNDEDYQNYGKIIYKTASYRRDNDPQNSKMKSSRGIKYRNIIKPIVDELEKKKKMEKDVDVVQGLGLKKRVTNAPVEYVYWNTLDELLERLYILYGEIKSGNTNPTLYNEIVSIIQEFKEI